MTKLLPGTASWTDKPLIEGGRFYPPEAKSAEARLRYYATQFPLVEVDAPYYGLPTVAQAERWVGAHAAGRASTSWSADCTRRPDASIVLTTTARFGGLSCVGRVHT